MNQYEEIKIFLIKNKIKFKENKIQDTSFLIISYGLGNYFSVFRQNKKNKKTQYRNFFMTRNYIYKKEVISNSKFMYLIKQYKKMKRLKKGDYYTKKEYKN